MRLSPFPTFLAFLTRKLGWIRANQKTLTEIRREALGRRLDVKQTGSLLNGLVRACWLRLGTTKMAAALSIGDVSTRCSFPGHLRQKGQKGGACHDAKHLSDLSDTEAAVAGHLEEIPGRACGAPRKPWAADRDAAEEKASR